MESSQPTAPIKYLLGVCFMGNNWDGMSILQSIVLYTNYLHQWLCRAARSAVPAVPNNSLVVMECMLPVGTCPLCAEHHIESCHVVSHHRWDVTQCNPTQCSAGTAADQNSAEPRGCVCQGQWNAGWLPLNLQVYPLAWLCVGSLAFLSGI